MAQLTCTADSANPAAVLTWKHNNVVITNTRPYNNVAGSNYGTVTSQTLVITPTRGMNGDRFSCSANNPATSGTVNSNAITIDVKCELQQFIYMLFFYTVHSLCYLPFIHVCLNDTKKTFVHSCILTDYLFNTLCSVHKVWVEISIFKPVPFSIFIKKIVQHNFNSIFLLSFLWKTAYNRSPRSYCVLHQCRRGRFHCKLDLRFWQ